LADEELKLDEHIQIYKDNRIHIRDLSKILVPVDGFTLTGALGLLYFILDSNNNNGTPINPWVIYLLLATSILMTGSIVSSIQSVITKTQNPLLTKFQYLDELIAIYKLEYEWADFSVVLLLFGIAAFIVAMGIFAWDYL